MRILLVITATLITIIFVSSCSEKEGEKETNMSYTNPMTLEDEWEDYGLGDPYVLKHNGVYYLYVSTRDTDIGVKGWSSTNLVDWHYEGLVTEEPKTKAAYAPEVIYWNGSFYMYTSPAGNGHYILKSDSPTGPFQLASTNLGKSIDGNVFIDDDGSMYFSHAGDAGIEVAPMRDPLTIGTSVTTKAYMDGWTEGSTLFKRNGKYYMTYTGNHVFSNAYRVDYASSDDPIKGYKPSEQNPILLNTDEPVVGLGHNSVVKGPNLDTDFIIYHNLEGPGVVGPLRHMNMDRLAWNGDKMMVLGPTISKQPVPEQPDFEDRFNRDKVGVSWDNKSGDWEVKNKAFLSQTSISSEQDMVVTEAETTDNYTAEFHAKMMKGSEENLNGLFGAVFSYQDDDNYGMALLSVKENSLLTRFVADGIKTEWESSELPPEFDYTKLHQIRIEKYINSFKVYVDGMHKQTIDSTLDGGKIGYMTEDVQAAFGYTAFSNDVNGNSIWDLAKPVPGSIQAVHYKNGGEGEGYHSKNEKNNDAYRFDPINIQSSDDRYTVRLEQQGDWLAYNANVSDEGVYHLDLSFATDKAGASLRLLQGDKYISEEIKLPNTKGKQNWRTITTKDLELAKGEQELKVELVEGEVNLESLTFYEADNVEEINENFTEGLAHDWMMYEGYWSVENNVFQPSERKFSKALVGKDGWTDYTIEADIQLGDTGGDAGILIRALNAANGLERNQNNGDFVQGYYAFIREDGVYLGKQDYNWEELEKVEINLDEDIFHHVKVAAIGTEIKVYVNDMKEPKIVYKDESNKPFTHGKVGVRNNNSLAQYDSFQVIPE